MDGKQHTVFKTDSVVELVVTPDDKIVSLSSGGIVRVWDMNGKGQGVCQGQGVGFMAATPDGKIVLGSGWGRLVCVSVCSEKTKFPRS